MPKNATILVTGVPGNVGSVGRSVVKLLRERDLPVRALVLRLDERAQALREETGAELVVADLTNGADVVRALRGCKRMYFGMSVSPLYLQATAIAAAATKEISDCITDVDLLYRTACIVTGRLGVQYSKR